MSAPFIWIILPIIISLFLWLPRRANVTAFLGGFIALLFAFFASVFPIDTALRISANISLKITPGLQVLGRQILLSPERQSLLVLIYGLAALWFFGSGAAAIARRLVPVGLAITAFLVASLAVEPFLYAALLIQTAVLLSIPLLSPPNEKPGRGVLRFLIYQTLAMPFILFAGWLLAGVESSPGDIELVVQSATLLALGFGFLLAIFPLYTWIPILLEETSPYAVGFILWLLSTATLLFAASFLNRYAWLREFPELTTALRGAGLLMIVSGGLWAAFQRHLGRMMGYAAVMNTGFALLSLSLFREYQLSAFFLLLVPQALGLAVWALALSILKLREGTLQLNQLQGFVQRYPVLFTGLMLAHFSAASLPLLASFPPILAIWEGVARETLGGALWISAGFAGLFTAAIRTLAVGVMSSEDEVWSFGGSYLQNILIGIGIILLVILGIFPQILHPLLVNLPTAFERLGG